MKLQIILTTVLFANPVIAEGDAAAGEKSYRQCQSCHEIVADDGTVIVRGGNTGPNLWGLPGRVAGTQSDFNKYKKSIISAGETGLVWDEENFLGFVQDPTKFLRELTGDSKARSGMAVRVRREDDIADLWAYIVSVSPKQKN